MFAAEFENNAEVSFLDYLILRHSTNFVQSVKAAIYRKPTLTGQNTNFNFFHFSRKIAASNRLAFRVIRYCSFSDHFRKKNLKFIRIWSNKLF